MCLLEICHSLPARNQLANWNKIIQLTLAGEESFYVAFIDKRMSYGPGRTASADLEFVSRPKDFFHVIIRKTKFDQSFSDGIYTMHGSITNAVRLMRVAELAFESHPGLNRAMRAALRIFT